MHITETFCYDRKPCRGVFEIQLSKTSLSAILVFNLSQSIKKNIVQIRTVDFILFLIFYLDYIHCSNYICRYAYIYNVICALTLALLIVLYPMGYHNTFIVLRRTGY